jgi:phage shock protein E
MFKTATLSVALCFILLSLSVLSCSDSAETTYDIPDLSIEDAVALLERNPAVVVLDIRTPEEFGKGHIAGAENIDFRRLDFRELVENLDRSKDYLLHCASGGRSTRALWLFDELGFERVHHMNKGFNAWARAGQPIVR